MQHRFTAPTLFVIVLFSAIGFFSIPATASAALSPNFLPSRTSGVAPLAVFFDTASSTSASTTDNGVTTRPFHDLDYAWDFNDSTAGVWTYGTASSSKNVAYGPEAAHVFETPGIYTVTMTARDGSSSAATTTTITVTDPNTVFAGTATVCVNNMGDSDFTACPSGATHNNTSSFATAVGYVVGSVKRVLLKRSGTFTASVDTNLNVAGPGIVGDYGPGAKPIISSSQTSGYIFMVGSTATDWRIMNLDIRGSLGTSIGFGLAGGGGSSQVMLWNANISNTQGGIIVNDAQATNIHDQAAIVGCTVSGLLGGAGADGFFGGGTQFMFLGNTITNINVEHNTRFTYVDRGVIAHNTLDGAVTGRHVIKLHGPSNPSTGVWTGIYTEKVEISDNKILAGQSGQYVYLAPEDNAHDERLRNIIFERNWVLAQSSGGQGILIAAQLTTIRNNVLDFTSAPSCCSIPISAARRGIEPSPQNVFVYNNSEYTNTAATNFIGVYFDSTVSNSVAKNNLAYAPNATTNNSVMTQDDSGTNALSNNSTTNQLKNTSPLFTNLTGSFSSFSDFQLKVGSYALGAGTSTPPVLGMLYDFTRTLRQIPTSMGAFDVNPPTLTTGAASAITTTTVTLGGNITITGGVNSTARGIVYGLSSSYTATSSESGSFTTGAFTEPITGLTCGTPYHFAAYATNSIGSTYGSDANFTTSSCVTAPTVTTQAASSLAATTATLNGNITAIGGAGPTVRGFAYGTSATLATVIATTTDSAGQPFSTGAFTGTVSSLTCNTTYFARAYATNSAGDSLGSIQSFTTSACSVAAVPSPPSSMGGGCSPGFVWNLGKMACVQTVATVTTTTPAPYPSGLSSVQVQAILSLLNSFGVDQTTLTTVTTILTGSPNSSSASAGTASGTFTFTRDLQLHQTGADVLALQQYLNNHGFVIAQSGAGSPGHETTYFGLATYRALVKFQAAHNLPATGYFGPLTKKLIESLLQ